MKITFLGTGGGRFSAISQRRMTGGFRIDNLNGKNYHVDPGPIVHLLELTSLDLTQET